jgi:hypothetical protein
MPTFSCLEFAQVAIGPSFVIEMYGSFKVESIATKTFFSADMASDYTNSTLECQVFDQKTHRTLTNVEV